MESTCFTRTTGVDDLVVCRRGSGLLRPQSPAFLDVSGVVIERWSGNGVVAESEWLCKPNPESGTRSGLGMENMREVLKREAPREGRAAILTVEMREGLLRVDDRKDARLRAIS